MNGWEFDLDLLNAISTNDGWVPFSIRYGYQKISDFARKTPQWPAVPGTLWERVTS